MAGDTRDWDKEMAAIDQVIAKGGYVAPSGGASPAAPAAGQASAPAGTAPVRSGGARHFLAIWGRTAVGLGLAAGLYVWPWVHHCGFYLYFYLGAVALQAFAGLWIMRVSWVRRSGLSHILGFLMIAYAAWLGAAEILPRTGYAATAATWSCVTP